jgi:apolipoprotein N-acyltransferase
MGAYGLTWVTLAIASAPAVLADKPFRKPQLVTLFGAAAGLLALYGYGFARLAAPVDLSNLTIRVVQPDNPEDSKYDPQKFAANVERYLSLTRQPSASGRPPQIVIWSEGAIPAPIDQILDPQAWTSSALSSALQPGQTLMMGAIRTRGSAAAPLYFNSLFVLARDAGGIRLVSSYDKHRLTPFGEFMPFGSALEKIGLRKLVPLGDFTVGPEPAAIAPAGMAPFQPLICYESLFPGFTRAGARRTGVRPQWIANISNDSWFGRTAGPWQHLNLAAYRAIEEGLPMVRATPTGVSVVLDPYGRRLPKAELPLGQRGVIDAPLPRALRNNTLYYRYGDALFWVLVLLSTSLAVRQNVLSVKKP